MSTESLDLWIPGEKKICMGKGLVKSLFCCGDTKKVTLMCICSPTVDNCIWFHEGNVVVDQKDKYLLRLEKRENCYEATLIVSYPKLEDCGVYICVANDQYSSDVVDFKLHIKGVEPGPAPILFDAGRTFMDETSETLTLKFPVHCVVKPALVEWKKRDNSGKVILLKTLDGSEHESRVNRYAFAVRNERDNIYNMKMEILSVREGDEGMYTCKVANSHGEVTQNFIVKLGEDVKLPVFLSEPTVDRKFYSDDDFIVTAVVKLASAVRWINPAKGVISNSSNYIQSIVYYESTGTYLAELVILDVSVWDDGKWMCEVENSFGKACKQFVMTIYETTEDEPIVFRWFSSVPERVKRNGRVFLSFKLEFMCPEVPKVTWIRYLGLRKIYLREKGSEPYKMHLKHLREEVYAAELLYEEDSCVEGVYECVIETSAEKSATFHWNGKTVKTKTVRRGNSTKSEVEDLVVTSARRSAVITNRGGGRGGTCYAIEHCSGSFGFNRRQRSMSTSALRLSDPHLSDDVYDRLRRETEPLLSTNFRTQDAPESTSPEPKSFSRASFDALFPLRKRSEDPSGEIV